MAKNLGDQYFFFLNFQGSKFYSIINYKQKFSMVFFGVC